MNCSVLFLMICFTRLSEREKEKIRLSFNVLLFYAP